MITLARIAALVTFVASSAFTSFANASDVGGAPVIPPFEVVTAIRSMGLEPAGPVVRRGPVYVIRAYEEGDPVRVTVDARSGRVLTITEIIAGETARLGPVPMPPGSVPSVTYRSPLRESMAPPAAAVAPPVRQSAVTPRAPTPRPRPAPAVAPETTAAIPATPGKSIPAPVARSAAPPSSATAPEAPAAAAKTESQPVPVAPLL